MTHFTADVRYALRGFRRNPIFATAAVALLALGIGLNTAAFSLFDAIVLRPLPSVGSPSDLVELNEHGASYPSYQFMRDGASRSFAGIGAWANRWVAISGRGPAERVRGTVVSGNYFEVLRIVPALGRVFAASDEEMGAPIAILSDAAWRKFFATSDSVVGRNVVLNGVAFEIVGVAPRGFRGVGFDATPDVYVPVWAWPRLATGPMARLEPRSRNWGWMSMFGRLRTGVSIGSARAEVEAVLRREIAAFPKDLDPAAGIRVRSLSSAAAGGGSELEPARLLAILLGAVGLVLVIGCANLANLLLARAAGRRKEIAVRLALGASRGRLIGQLLTESFVLAVAGGAAGVAVAAWALALATRMPLPGGTALSGFGAALDGRVLLFTGGVSVLTAILFGILPALQGSRTTVVPALKDEPAGGAGRGIARTSLVAAQLALCLVLLSGAGLFLRSLANALGTDIGFQPKGVVQASMNLGLARYDAARAAGFARAFADRVSGLPGIRSTAWAGSLPLSGEEDVESVQVEGAAPGKRESVAVQPVGPDYFSTIGIPILEGREFAAALDTPSGPGAVVVNHAAARRFWPGRSALGRRMSIAGGERMVVGVARDSRYQSWGAPAEPMVYLNGEQLGSAAYLSTLTFIARTSADPSNALAGIRGAAASLDPALPIFGMRRLDDSITDLLLPQRLGSSLLGLFGLLALALAEIGVYATVAGSVLRRVRELGIRIALGAHPSRLRRMVILEMAAPVAAGLAAGIPLALLASRFLGRFLFGVRPADALTLLVSALLLVAGAFAAADLPARKAARVSPMEALRNE